MGQETRQLRGGRAELRVAPGLSRHAVIVFIAVGSDSNEVFDRGVQKAEVSFVLMMVRDAGQRQYAPSPAIIALAVRRRMRMSPKTVQFST